LKNPSILAFIFGLISQIDQESIKTIQKEKNKGAKLRHLFSSSPTICGPHSILLRRAIAA